MSLATITQLVADKVRTLALGSDLASPLLIERAIGQAVLQYGLDAPQQLTQTLAGVSGDTLPVPTEWAERRSDLVAVEWPVGRAPMAVLPASVANNAGGQWLILLLVDSLIDATVRVHFTAPHVCTATHSTVPAQHENALACWAAAELCRQLATQKGHERDAGIGAAATIGQSQSADLARRARDWDRQYRQVLGLPDPEAATGGQAAGTVVQFGRARQRGRLSSLGY